MTPRPTPVVRTARLVLRPRVVDDAVALHRAFADVDAMRWWSGPPHRDLVETRRALSASDPAWRAWAIVPANGVDAIGFVAAGEKRQGNVSEIAYLLARPHWGAGLAHEAVSAIVGQLFAEGQRRVFADIDPDHLASRRLVERIGFRLEGVLRAEWETHIGVRDTALYGLIASEWPVRGD